MFISKDGRSVSLGEEVFIYRNLRNGMWSIQKATRPYHVLGYSKTLKLENATYHVNEKGRQRVNKERCKNVHAKVKGTLVSFDYEDINKFKPAYYNPYKTKTFIDLNTNEPLYFSKVAYFHDGRAYYE